MSNKSLDIISIDPSIILENIKRAKTSIRKVAKKTDYSERTIRSYLKRGEMPERLIKQIDNAVRPKVFPINIKLEAEIWIAKDELRDLIVAKRYTAKDDIELCDIDAEYLWITKGHCQILGAKIDRKCIERLEPFANLLDTSRKTQTS